MRESEKCRERAETYRQEAEDAQLANVRDRCLRAEAAWTAMAERSARIEQARDVREAATGPISVDHDETLPIRLG